MQKMWRIFYGIIFISSIGYCLYSYFGVGGDVTLVYKFNRADGLISEFTPHGRALDREQNTTTGDYYQRLVSEPVYFTAQLPGIYPTADVAIEYQNPAQNIVQLGLQLADEPTPADTDWRTIENKFIDTTSASTVVSDKYVLDQTVPTYTSIDDFWANLPTTGKIGTSLSRFPVTLRDAHYQPSQLGATVTVPVQGPQDLSVYIKDETLQISFTYAHLPDVPGEDIPFNAVVLNPAGAVVWSGDLLAPQLTPQKFTISIPNLSEGSYRIQVNCSTTTYFTEVKSDQHHLVWNKSVRLADVPQTAVTLYTNTRDVSLRANSATGVGDVQFINKKITVGTVNATYLWINPLPYQLEPFTTSQRDLSIATTGNFSFSAEAWFDPNQNFKPLSAYSSPTDFDYVITEPYSSPATIRGWITATAKFDLTKSRRTDPTELAFVLSAPGLDMVPQGIKVRSITITVHKEPLTLQNLWTRLSNKL